VSSACWRHTGESGLHLAVVNNDLPVVRRLLACGADVNRRASGRFFLPEDQKQLRNGITDYSGLLNNRINSNFNMQNFKTQRNYFERTC